MFNFVSIEIPNVTNAAKINAIQIGANIVKNAKTSTMEKRPMRYLLMLRRKPVFLKKSCGQLPQLKAGDFSMLLIQNIFYFIIPKIGGTVNF